MAYTLDLQHIKVLTGACAIGVAPVTLVSEQAREQYNRWIALGHHATMYYMERYTEVRDNPALLLEGAKSMIVCAFSYRHSTPKAHSRYRIAHYAQGADYHDIIKNRMGACAAYISDEYGAKSRICVDTAPLRERYWAAKLGLGFIGSNNTLIIPGAGSLTVLGTILSTEEFESAVALPHAPISEPASCQSCGRCERACPGRALIRGRAVDASKCLSYLTIEHRGELPAGVTLNGSLAGCDICQNVCPWNEPKVLTVNGLAEFEASNPILDMTDSQIEALEETEIKSLLRGSALSRIKPADMLRNIHHK